MGSRQWYKTSQVWGKSGRTRIAYLGMTQAQLPDFIDWVNSTDRDWLPRQDCFDHSDHLPSAFLSAPARPYAKDSDAPFTDTTWNDELTAAGTWSS